MDDSMDLFEEQILHITQDKFYLEALTAPQQFLVIDRVSHEAVIETNHGQIPTTAESKPICGMMGVIWLLAGPYLIIITKKVKVGEIAGQSVWRVAETEAISYARTLYHLNDSQKRDNDEYKSMVDQVLRTPSYYFSYTYDLTHTLQRLYNTSPDFKHMSMCERADQRFIWNGHLLRDLISIPELHRYCLPVVHGFISVRTTTVRGYTISIGLVSRRSCFRAGARLFMRGLDTDGHAANYVETEQIVEYSGNKLSYVQTRGSIPLYWVQEPNLKYKPDPVVVPTYSHIYGYQRHFENQLVLYGRQILINLIDQKGPEGRLEQALEGLVKEAQNMNIKYEAFDFHHECRKMRWDRLSILMERIREEQEQLGYFLMLRDGTVAQQQEGVFRTNCIDCLDRTNVVQSLISKVILEKVLKKLLVMEEKDRVEDHPDLWSAYRHMWADNADSISIQYSGTRALKTDYTRTGVRTKWGLLQDGINASVRYFKNNFSDGYRQDAVDLFLGNYVVDESEGLIKPSPLQRERGWRFLALPGLLCLALCMFIFVLAVPAEYSTDILVYLLFWGGMVMIIGAIILYYGTEFVDKPRLYYNKSKKED